MDDPKHPDGASQSAPTMLVSAFAYAPGVGSEPGVGWRWVQELAKTHQVVVLTDTARRAAVEGASPQASGNPVEVVFYRPRWLSLLPQSLRRAQLIYVAWQFGCVRLARTLAKQRRFDVAIHVTYGVFRHPCFLGALGVPFIFGPVGGGEEAPLRLMRSLGVRALVPELFRIVLNRIARYDPFLRYALSKSNVILVKTDETKRALPGRASKKAIVCREIGIDVPADREPITLPAAGPFRALFAGRLIAWKGVHLAIRAIGVARDHGADWHLDVIGKGPHETQIRSLVAELDLEDYVTFHGAVPQTVLFDHYTQAQCLLFPSLHDSSGNVVLEAMSFGLPVICLDLGGPKHFVQDDWGRVVATERCSETNIANKLADALTDLVRDPVKFAALSRSALDAARAFTWASAVRGALGMLPGHRCDKAPPPQGNYPG